MALGETGAVMMLVWLPPFLPGLPRPGPIKMGGPQDGDIPLQPQLVLNLCFFFFGSESFEESRGVV